MNHVVDHGLASVTMFLLDEGHLALVTWPCWDSRTLGVILNEGIWQFIGVL